MLLGSMIRSYRFLIGALTALMLILLLRSSTTKHAVSLANSGRLETPDDFHTAPIVSTPGYLDDVKTAKGNPEVEKASKEQLVDSASSSTSKCNEDHRYVIMIDAGSTGSRIHVYEFDICTQPPTLINEGFKMINPGLSS